MSSSHNRRLLLAALPTALLLGAWGFGFFSPLTRVTQDWILRGAPSQPTSQKIQFVAFDDATYRHLGKKPSRAVYAELLETLGREKANLVVLDVLFTQHKDPPGTLKLAQQLASVDTVLACNPQAGLQPLPILDEQAIGLGSVDILIDSDGLLRRLPTPYADQLLDPNAQATLPIALETARILWDPEGDSPVLLGGDSLTVAQKTIPTDGPSIRIRFPAPQSWPDTLSMGDNLSGKSSIYPGAVVFVGNSRAVDKDRYPVPTPPDYGKNAVGKNVASGTVPGALFHAAALQSLLSHSVFRMAPNGFNIPIAFLFFILGIIPFFTKPSSPWIFILGGLLVVGGTAGGTIVMARHSFLWDPAPPLLAFIVLGSVALADQNIRHYRKRREVEGIFGHYVSPNVAKVLMNNPSLIQRPTHREDLSILFSDIRSFTSMSESMDPQAISHVLRRYFDSMTSILFHHDGTLDKFIGDAILAFFGDPLKQPDHLQRAVRCAVAMQERMVSLRKEMILDGLPELRIGISVTTGPVSVGNQGSSKQFDYTVIGDRVNLASRLQGLAIQNDVIVPRSVFTALGQDTKDFSWEELDPVTVKGKSNPIPILRVSPLGKNDLSGTMSPLPTREEE